MRHKRLKLSAILLLGLGLTGLQAQTMYVKELNGSQSAYVLSNIRKMSFTLGSLNVIKTDNSVNVYAVNNLRYLNFIDNSLKIKEQVVQKEGIITYPNPIINVLKVDISGLSKNGIISIISLDGKTIKTEHIKNKEVLLFDLSDLPQGIYLCRYINLSETKTVKIIKQ